MKSPYSSQTVPMGRWIALAMLCMAFASPVAASVQATYYVSPSGNDSDPGTEARPFHTIAKARDVVRTVNTTMTGDIVVQLRGGTYPLDSTLTFGTADGGNNGYYVRYMNYTGEKPLLTGGQPITGWTISDADKNIWKATGVKSRFRQLYVRGTKAIRARDPNLGTDGSADFYRLVQVDKTGQTLQVESSRISNWKNFTKAEMHLMQAWGDDVLRLASISASGTNSNLTIQDPEGTIMFNRPYPMLGSTFSGQQQCYYFENAYELLDQPGEWYLDESTNTVYYMPRTGEDMTKTKVVAPQLETLVSVGGPSTSQTVGYLSFQGLAFAHSTYMRPSQYGFLDAQAGQYNVAATLDNKQYVARPPAGIAVSNAHHIRFEGNLFAQMAATGLDFVSGTHDDAIVGNVLTDIGGNGISIGKFTADETTEFHIPYDPSDKAEICTNDTIRNNLVTKVTTEMQGAIGIAAGYPRYLVLEHNEISYTNYTGISVGYGWSHSTNAMSGNKINWNNIHHITQIMADAGGIYTLSNQEPNSEIQYNYLHDYGASQWADYGVNGIYLDEGSGGYDISHNVFANAPSNLFFNGTSQWNTASDNDGNAASTISDAGIEAAYANIKQMTIPVPKFPSDSTSPVVAVYQNYNYDGLEAQLSEGSYTKSQLVALGVTDNDISSMQVDAGLTVELFDDDNFQTPLGTFTSDQPNFGNLGINDKVTSLRISRTSTGIRNQTFAKKARWYWSAGALVLPETKTGKLQIVDSRGKSKIVEVSEGRAATGPLPTGLYQARILDGTSSGFQSVLVLP